MFKVGAIYSDSFLWSRQKETGEESGRKDRPACLLVRPADNPELLFLFPITSRDPGPHPFADRIPQVECRRAGLREPAWIVMDEVNITLESTPYDFVSLAPIGEFSPAYRQKLLAIAKSAIAARRMKVVKR